MLLRKDDEVQGPGEHYKGRHRGEAVQVCGKKCHPHRTSAVGAGSLHNSPSGHSPSPVGFTRLELDKDRRKTLDSQAKSRHAEKERGRYRENN